MADVTPLAFRIDWEISGATHSHVLPEGETLIGSSAECQVRLRSPVVSRRHAVVRLHAGRLAVEDLQSKNGVKVGGTRVAVSPLTAGDTVEIGPIALTIRSVDPEDTVLALAAASAPTHAPHTPAGPRTRTKTPSGAGTRFAAADWGEGTITWNSAPLAHENVGGAWVDPIVVFPGWPGVPRSWDVSYPVARAYHLGQPLRLVLYSADSDYHTGK